MRWSSALTIASLCVWVVPAFAAQTPTATRIRLVHKTKYAMGTVYEIASYDEDTNRAAQAMDKAFAEIVRLDGVLSNYKPESELSQLNRNGHFQRVRVSPDLYRIIEESVKYSRASGGKFDITVLPLVDLWKAALRGGSVPTAAEQDKARSCVGYEKIELIAPDEVEFHSSCLRIDVGSIGKGYAVDRAVEILRANGLTNALVDAGQSSIYALGAPPGMSAWEVHLRDPSRQVDPVVFLKDNSVSTSEQTPASLLGNEVAGHIIDPENGQPLQTDCALSIVAKTATATDGLSTALLLVGPERGKSLVKGIPDAAAIWISPSGEVDTASTGPEIRLAGKKQAENRRAGVGKSAK